MAELKNVFLSASVPSPNRDIKYYGTADLIAIREAVRALANVVVPNFRLIWGGHPAITPLIRRILQEQKIDLKKQVTLYQSKFFEDKFPKDNEFFENIHLTESKATQEESLAFMRDEMIRKNNFVAGFFIGGMEGVEEEFKIFSSVYKSAKFFPVASTGAAAKLIFDRKEFAYDSGLEDELSYETLFERLVEEL